MRGQRLISIHSMPTITMTRLKKKNYTKVAFTMVCTRLIQFAKGGFQIKVVKSDYFLGYAIVKRDFCIIFLYKSSHSDGRHAMY